MEGKSKGKIFITCCADCSKQTDVHSCGIFAGFYAREAEKGSTIGGVAPPDENFVRLCYLS
ncbi:hypothetical protein PsorP6_014737 [Peronosclerospora sorghi]|uniref:Uncharacterized protein n=1 Tax=Peronosclerospora sorghi TaxID=230839 RepID=A0ACC0VT80_9STRA|nr:hypothetical protein PsorP6_014737 [Peronosclerospora sorghi]